ncbi:glutathione S-transferase family protein [Brevundimonas sp. S30B]|uniref:glutathione S-transferase family protein n=1 Tax=unclassified Brevundimonas TaxID=2622653 RepID=UPI00107177C2|nr:MULTISPECIES: glutathione S-transferase family protein [unclassified Brevundimonas]QBX38564.1 glutathione S-transferase family protein [Brevundimonas sp. MF30-B]TFW00486.1 glutathione S-transferase family protein [Brevundimonas sp. S30B]TFW01867.1 glutathione S-transferase family protein [Brevundimonas sp. S30B]
MGQLVDGVWSAGEVGADSDGSFKRKASRFRNWVTGDAAAGPTGEGGFEAEPGRYHLYVSLACPWAHRTLIMRRFKGLDGMIGVSTVHWLMRDDGWTFAEGPDVTGDPIHGADFLHQVYTAADADYTGKVTVPVLWDKARETIVSNESADIIRMFNSAFDGVGATEGDYYPEALRGEIDAVNDRVYAEVNNGVYRAGFAETQAAYEEAVGPLFEALDWLEARLSDRPWLMGDRLTEADIRLFTTLVRFDLVYHGHFKCNRRRIVDYPALWRFVRDFHALPGVAETVNVDHIKRHYYESHRRINPTGVVPVGPDISFAV